MASTESESTEIKPRRKGTASALAVLCPGLAYLYAGEFKTGVLTNALFVLALLGFILAWTVSATFPLVPGIVFALGWIVFTVLVALDVRQRIDRRDEPFELQGFNHWTVYSGVFLLTFALPIAGLFAGTGSLLWNVQKADSPSMYPNIQSGDVVLIQKTAYRNRRPRPGELVALQSPGERGYRIQRVVAAGNSTVRLSSRSAEQPFCPPGPVIRVGDRRIPRVPLDEDANATLAQRSDTPSLPPSGSKRASARSTTSDEGTSKTDSNKTNIELLVEQNAGRKYVIAVQVSGDRSFDNFGPAERELCEEGPVESRPSEAIETYNLADEELFTLSDHRTGSGSDDERPPPADGRTTGPADLDSVAGRPLYIAWSSDPQSGTVRWERIGLRLQ